MRTFLSKISTLCLVLFLAQGLKAQTPQHAKDGNTIASGIFLGSGSYKKFQEWYNPGDFNTLPPSGLITTLYFRNTNASETGTYADFEIGLKQPTSGTEFASTTFETGFTQVLSASSITLTGNSTAQGWFAVNLNTPFLYDNTKPLVFEMKYSSITSGGISTRASNTGGPLKKIYSTSLTATSGTAHNAYWQDFGFDVIPRSGYNNAGVAALTSPQNFCIGTHAVKAEIGNYGQNKLDSVRVYWSVDNTPQTPVYVTTAIDTFGSSGGNTLEVTLGSLNFSNFTAKTITVWTSHPNGVTDTITANDTITVSVQPALNGSFTVGGTNPDYSTLNALLDDLKNVGICGPVSVEIRAGTYNEALFIPEIPGTNATNTITFAGADSSTTTISGTDNTSNATITFDGADYITFKNLSIINPKSGADCWGILFTNQANHNTIDACHIEVPVTTNLDVVGITGTGSFTIETTEGNNANYLTVMNSYVSGGEKCISFEGDGNSSPTVGNKFLNNYLTQSDDYGIYLDDQDSLVISGNTIENLTATAADGIYSLGGGHYLVEKNRISVPGYGIYLNDLSQNFAGGTSSVINNMVSSSGTYGIYLNDVDDVDVFHNSVVGEPAMQINDMVGLDIRNNIFYSVNSAALDATDADPFSTLDYNLYYTINGTNLIEWGSNTYSTLGAWQTAQGYDANSVSGDPIFVSLTDLHLVGTLANDIGDNSVGVTEDIDGETRPFSPSTVVDLGADEIKVLNNDAGVISVNAVCVNGDLQVQIRNYGAKVLTSFAVNYSIDGVGQTPVAFSGASIASSGDTIVSLGTAILQGGQAYDLVFWTSSPNGVSDPQTSNDSLSISGFRTGLNGTVTIGGTGADFADLTEAVTALNNFGICGNVVFEIAKGTYNEQIAIGNYSRASSGYGVTFRSATGDARDVRITYPSGSGSNYTIRIEGDNVTLEYLTIERTGTDNNGIAIDLDGSDNITIQNNIILGDSFSTSTNTTGTRSAIFSSDFNAENNVSILNNIIHGNANGVWYSGIQSSPSSNMLISANDISVGYTAVFLNYAAAPVVEKNHITRIDKTVSSTFYGISFQEVSGAARVLKNTLLFYESYGYGIRMRNTVGNSGDPVLIANNMVSMDGSSTAYAFSTESSSSYIHIYHNSGLITGGTSTTTRPYYATSLNSSTGIEVVNNIFVNHGNGYAVYVVGTSTPAITRMDYNILHSDGSNLAYWGTATADLAALQSASAMNQNSVVLDADFVSNTNLRLNTLNKNYVGTPLSGVTDDIDGNPRCAVPVKGAYEGPAPAGTLTVDFSVPDTVFNGGRTIFINSALRSERKIHEWFIDGVSVSEDLNLEYTFGAVGTYEIKLVTTGCTSSDSAIKTVDVIAPFDVPVADFIADRTRIFEGEFIQLTDLSTQAPTAWTWSISPATGATFTSQFAQDPLVFFSESGVYDICLIAENSFGQSQQLCKQAFVEVFPVADMCATPMSNALNGKLYDDGGFNGVYGNNLNCTFLIQPCASSVTAFIRSWDFPDVDDEVRIYNGTTQDPNNLLATFNANSNNPGGTVGVTAQSGAMLIVLKTDGSTSGNGFEIEWQGVPINGGLSAGFDIPDTGFINSPVYINNTAQGSQLNYDWDTDLPNNVDVVSVDGKLTAMYTAAGTYTIRQIVTGCGTADTIHKDIVIVSPVDPPSPVDFTANRTTLTPDDLLVLTDISGNGPTAWTWEISPANGVSFVNGNNKAIAEVQFTFPGTYDVKLVVSNAIGTDSIVKTAFITVVEYCNPASAILSPEIGISRVLFEGINNNSLIGQNAYSDYTQTGMEAILVPGEDYDITLERNNTSQSMTRKVWIDWNQDGDFNDAMELVTSEMNANTAQFTGTVSVPATAELGITRMRIGAGYQNDPSGPCGPALLGEFEDYRIVVSADNVKPIITIIGSNPFTIEVGNPYVDAGATAFDAVDGNITAQIVMSTNVDISKVGCYEVIYTVFDAAGNYDSAVRVVCVTPDTTSPIITLLGNAIDTIEVFNSYNDPGVTAIDPVWGTAITNISITGNLDTAKLGTYIITYTATDSAGNQASVSRTVVVVDTTAPVISLNGSDPIIVDVHTSFIDPGATATDNYWNPVSVIVTGSVDTAQLGTYVLTYVAVDGSGNQSAPITRTVEVVDRQAPLIQLVGNDFVNLFRWQDYTDSGYTLSDNYYDSVDITVDTLGDWVSSSLEGLYYIQYRATDPSGNVSLSAKRIIDVRGMTSVNEVNKKADLSIYPNPSSGIFTLELRLPSTEKTSVFITDMAGKTVKEIYSGEISNWKQEIDMSNAAPGTYLVRVISGSITENRKIIISR